MINLKNHFLLAMPNLLDARFKNSLIYLCEHSEDGAMGLIVNHRNTIKLEKIFNQLEIQYKSEIKFLPTLKGGPMSEDRGFVLHTNDSKTWESTNEISSDVCISTSKDILRDIAIGGGPKESIIILGYSSWTAGQLERELSENSWLTLPSNNDILFRTSPEKKASKAAKLIGFDLNKLMPNYGNA